MKYYIYNLEDSFYNNFKHCTRMLFLKKDIINTNCVPLHRLALASEILQEILK